MGIHVEWLTGILYLGSFVLMYFLGELRYSIKNKVKAAQRKGAYIINWFERLVIILPFAIICGMRDTSVGHDTLNVVRNYFRLGDGTYEVAEHSFSVLYRLVYKAIYIVSNGNRFAGLFVLSMLSLLFILYSYEYMLVDMKDVMAAYILFTLYIAPIMMDQSRQFIAVGAVAVAVCHLFRHEKCGFVIWILLAALFHESAIVLLPLVLIKRRKLSVKAFRALLVSICLGSMLAMPYVLRILFYFLPAKYQYIAVNMHTPILGKAWIVDIMPMAASILIFYISKAGEKLSENIEVMELLAWSVLFFRYAGYYSFFIMRMSYYGEAICPVIAMMGIRHMKSGWKRRAAALFLIFVYLIHFWIDFVVLKLNKVAPYVLYSG